MPNLTPMFYSRTGTTKTNHYIETGTYRGDGIRRVLNNYEKIHSIELSEKWYRYNTEQFKNCKNVKIYLGDSKKVLPALLNTIEEPATIFLDAHYSGAPTAMGEEQTPLLHELELLKSRQYDDIIIIADCRMLGKAGTCGGSPTDPVYPLMNYDWREITEEKITKLMKKGYTLLKNYRNEYTDGATDQYILTRK